ncbi:MAG TPA: hemerythrin domain-containing protein [Pyrinomonadaceae bacterium]|nr:hemerythrin domain-containing protein [Pyrinomonadaceae bacterium]
MADPLVKDHAELDHLFRDLLVELDRGGARRVLPKLDMVWARLAVHIRAEHLHLFPALLKAADRTPERATVPPPAAEEVRACVERLREDHDFFMRELAGCVNALRDVAAKDSPPDEQLRSVKRRVVAVCERLAEHNRLEEERAYPWRQVLLEHGEQEELLAMLKREIENLPPRFTPPVSGANSEDER